MNKPDLRYGDALQYIIELQKENRERRGNSSSSSLFLLMNRDLEKRIIDDACGVDRSGGTVVNLTWVRQQLLSEFLSPPITRSAQKGHLK